MNNPKAIVTLAIGDSYFDMAVACINSARKKTNLNVTYVIFYGNIKNENKFSCVDGVELINIDDIIYSRRTKDELSNLPFLYREFKSILFSYDKYLGYDLLFLDADSIVFEDKFDEIFDLISK